MNYRKLFDPQATQRFAAIAGRAAGVADRREESVYVYSEEIVLAVNVALATGRPLLVRGASGSGKSSLARNVAKVLGRRYYEAVVTSRTQARDLLWEVDLLRRLQDAQAKQLKKDLAPYVYPRVLWWAFDRDSARQQLGRTPLGTSGTEPGDDVDQPLAVVLLDEIDKADPDVPNNLLVPLGSLSFRVEETGTLVSAPQPPLVFLTTNEERDLPAAFLRRCVELKLKSLQAADLVRIGTAHFPQENTALLVRVAELIEQLSKTDPGRSTPSAAEYLDTVRACIQLQVTPESEAWKDLSNVTVWKHGRTGGARA